MDYTFMETVLFWATFTILSGWVLSRFYFSKNVALVERLRIVACTLGVATLGLLYFAWGMTIFSTTGLIALFVLLLAVAVLLSTSNPSFSKLAASLHFLSTVYIFTLLMWMFPTTITLTTRDIAIIIAVLFMLVNAVVLLLLWHRLDLLNAQARLKDKLTKKTMFFILGIIVVGLTASIIFTLRSETSVFHSQNGFTLHYPKAWFVDTSVSESPIEFIREPRSKAFFSIQSHIDPRLKSPSELPVVYKNMENAFKNDLRYTVEESGWEYEDKNIANNSYFTAGLYLENGTQWRFKEITIMSENGNVLVLRGMSIKDSASEYGPLLDKIFASVVSKDKMISTGANGEVRKERALLLVKNLPEVVQFQKMLSMSGKQATLEVEDGDNQWNVHVFEIVKNGDASHTATFGWYTVDKKTGVVEKGI